MPTGGSGVNGRRTRCFPCWVVALRPGRMLAMTDTGSSPATDPVREHLRRVLLANKAGNERRTAAIEAAEAAGRRIVNGGQISGQTWELHDWRTGEHLAGGDGGLDEMDTVGERLDPDGTWLHIDRLGYDDEALAYVETEGLPGDLNSALQEWLDNTGTSDEELAAFVGWPVEKVAACR
jgi:hypothetical protein